MEAVFLQIKSQGDGNTAIWKRIDSQLAQLCLKGPQFTEAFYMLVLDADNLLFNGKNTVTDLEDLTDFEIPTDSDNQAAIACLAPVVSVESGYHMNIGK
ncbi:hypothetical protein CROQUDRAFT_659926 [Cronartium quercuum f. sp. fusiforme G11]|uniref:Uncharacterized protein n=1 Tax=Cronartium quercuum f. sp. fusiforme G11 TaxID=708437 RepID=A0A9P6NEJ0_9BASI|nr:hypothetical protein CROQUDRAFT_659926 [Cronartium quercuum f. sp. fusiforme G11]